MQYETLTGGDDEGLVAGTGLQRRVGPQKHLPGGGVDGEEAVRDRLAASGGEQVVADGGTGAAGVSSGTQWTSEAQILVLSHGLVHDTCGKDTVSIFAPVPFLLLLPVIFVCSVSVYSLYVCSFFLFISTSVILSFVRCLSVSCDRHISNFSFFVLAVCCCLWLWCVVLFYPSVFSISYIAMFYVVLSPVVCLPVSCEQR